jgi:acyl dehydratase
MAMALNYEKIMAYRPGDIRTAYGKRDCILYALGIGLGMDPLDPGQLRFVYEKSLVAFPTLATTLGWMGRLTNPEFGIDERMVVLADQKVVLHRPLEAEATLISRPHVKEIIDKGPGNAAIIQVTRDLTTEDGTLVATVEGSTLALKHGGFGGKVTEPPKPKPIPARDPDVVCDLPTPPNLAQIFRLTGDTNPLHIDPERAKVAGFPRPILHGMASFGIAAHAILRTLAQYQPERLASIEARFSRPVFPGETIRTEMWQNGSEVVFRCRTVERGEITIDNGLALLR